jgi:hypothetical protein
MSDQSAKPMSFSMEKYFVALAAIRELRAALASITEDVLRISSDDMTNQQVNLVLDIIDTHTSNVSAHSATLDQSGSLHGHIAKAVQSLAVIIRAVDGDNRLGPSALAAAILAHPDLDWLPTSKTTLPITN